MKIRDRYRDLVTVLGGQGAWQAPTVHVRAYRGMDTKDEYVYHAFTPKQARKFARELKRAAKAAERD